jgi:hypothetical protein
LVVGGWERLVFDGSCLFDDTWLLKAKSQANFWLLVYFMVRADLIKKSGHFLVVGFW